MIELLVVITIIVVLLAMLMPALDQAVYQAQLASCAGQVRTIAASVQTYAFANRRAYPYRGAQQVNWYPALLYQPEHPQYDDRKVLQPFLPVNRYFIDPLQAPVDLEASVSWTYSSYMLWFGWRYTGTLGGPGSLRLGQGFIYGGKTYRLLVSDMDWQYAAASYDHPSTSHPDKADVLINMVRQDEGGPAPGVGRVNETKSTWWQNRDRGVIDTNYGFEDGSVIRYNDVVSPAFQSYRGDERMDQISYLRNTPAADYRAHVPR